PTPSPSKKPYANAPPPGWTHNSASTTAPPTAATHWPATSWNPYVHTANNGYSANLCRATSTANISPSPAQPAPPACSANAVANSTTRPLPTNCPTGDNTCKPAPAGWPGNCTKHLSHHNRSNSHDRQPAPVVPHHLRHPVPTPLTTGTPLPVKLRHR